jgi:hypothetical protein
MDTRTETTHDHQRAKIAHFDYAFLQVPLYFGYLTINDIARQEGVSHYHRKAIINFQKSLFPAAQHFQLDFLHPLLRAMLVRYVIIHNSTDVSEEKDVVEAKIEHQKAKENSGKIQENFIMMMEAFFLSLKTKIFFSNRHARLKSDFSYFIENVVLKQKRQVSEKWIKPYALYIFNERLIAKELMSHLIVRFFNKSELVNSKINFELLMYFNYIQLTNKIISEIIEYSYKRKELLFELEKIVQKVSYCKVERLFKPIILELIAHRGIWEEEPTGVEGWHIIYDFTLYESVHALYDMLDVLAHPILAGMLINRQIDYKDIYNEVNWYRSNWFMNGEPKISDITAPDGTNNYLEEIFKIEIENFKNEIISLKLRILRTEQIDSCLIYCPAQMDAKIKFANRMIEEEEKTQALVVAPLLSEPEPVILLVASLTSDSLPPLHQPALSLEEKTASTISHYVPVPVPAQVPKIVPFKDEKIVLAFHSIYSSFCRALNKNPQQILNLLMAKPMAASILEAIKKLERNDPIIRKALTLANHYYNNCSAENIELFRKMYCYIKPLQESLRIARFTFGKSKVKTLFQARPSIVIDRKILETIKTAKSNTIRGKLRDSFIGIRRI